MLFTDALYTKTVIKLRFWAFKIVCHVLCIQTKYISKYLLPIAHETENYVFRSQTDDKPKSLGW